MDDIESENAEKSRKVVSQVHLKTRLSKANLFIWKFPKLVHLGRCDDNFNVKLIFLPKYRILHFSVKFFTNLRNFENIWSNRNSPKNFNRLNTWFFLIVDDCPEIYQKNDQILKISLQYFDK